MTRKLMKTALLSGAAILALGLGIAPAAAATTDASSSSSSASSAGPTAQTTTTSADFDMNPNAAIALDSAPNISFGTNITPNGKSDMSYSATTADNPVEVANPGLASGWSVQVNNSAFTDTAGDTLKGAVLSLGEPDVAAANADNPSAAPTAGAIKLDGSGTNAVAFNAAAKGGLGVWDSEYGVAEIVLAVPAGQLPGTYTSNMNWQLNDTPQ